MPTVAKPTLASFGWGVSSVVALLSACLLGVIAYGFLQELGWFGRVAAISIGGGTFWFAADVWSRRVRASRPAAETPAPSVEPSVASLLQAERERTEQLLTSLKSDIEDARSDNIELKARLNEQQAQTSAEIAEIDRLRARFGSGPNRLSPQLQSALEARVRDKYRSARRQPTSDNWSRPDANVRAILEESLIQPGELDSAFLVLLILNSHRERDLESLELFIDSNAESAAHAKELKLVARGVFDGIDTLTKNLATDKDRTLTPYLERAR